jgi:transposase
MIVLHVPAPRLVCVELNPGPASRSKRTRKCEAVQGQHIDSFKKGRIVGLHEARLSKAEIARRTKTSRPTVRKTIEDFKATGGVPDRHAGGRKRKLDKKEREKVIKKAKKKKSVRKIADEYASKGKPISTETIRRTIREGGLAYMVRKKVTKLTRANIKKRLTYATTMKDFEWKLVLWSDEKTFYLGTEETKCWQDPENREERPVTPYPEKLNVWGAIGCYFKTPLYFFTDNLNSEQYTKILNARLPPVCLEDCPEEDRSQWVFMQDGARPHTSRESVALLNQIAPDRIKNHPPQSPDFNPMEDLWSYMDREVRKVKNIENIAGLKKELRKIWKNVPLGLVRASVGSMPKRLKQCVKLGGRRTSY